MQRALLVFLTLLLLPLSVEAAKPNIVVITVDDLDEATLSVAVSGGLMPSLKSKIIDQGYTFTNSFVVDSLCCPSRATFLSGQYAHNHHTLGNLPPAGSVTAFDASSTVATWLKAAGYRTAFVGKYLNGYGQFTPQTYVPPGWDDWQGLIDPSTYTAYDHKWDDNGTVVDDRPNGQQWWNYNIDRNSGDSIRQLTNGRTKIILPRHGKDRASGRSRFSTSCRAARRAPDGCFLLR